MDKKTINLIKQGLRSATLKWHIRNEVKNGAKIYKVVGKFKNGKPKKRVFFICAKCRKEFKSDEVQIDHIDEVGKFNGNWDEYISRMFCDIANLACLCKPCHLVKTNLYRSNAKSNKPRAKIPRKSKG